MSLSLAQSVNEWRVVPRILAGLYGWVCYDTHEWYIALSDPTGHQQMYATVVWGAAAAWFGLYTGSLKIGGK